jgi:hypothetical protein
VSYFRYFPRVDYLFGDEQRPDQFENISVYTEIIDSIKNNVAFYTDYYIQDGERPDQVSYNLYGTATAHWTFFLMNDKLRERGWPLTNREIYEKAQADYSETVLTTRTVLTDKFKVGQTITGTTSGATGTIDHRHLDLGQLVLSGDTGTFIAGETITSLNENDILETIVLTSTAVEYLSAHHYENASGEVVDIDPTVGPGALLTEVTYLDRYISMNDELKQIRIIKPEIMPNITKSYREAISS